MVALDKNPLSFFHLFAREIWMHVQNVLASRKADVETFQSKPQMQTSRWHQTTNQSVTKGIRTRFNTRPDVSC